MAMNNIDLIGLGIGLAIWIINIILCANMWRLYQKVKRRSKAWRDHCQRIRIPRPLGNDDVEDGHHVEETSFCTSDSNRLREEENRSPMGESIDLMEMLNPGYTTFAPIMTVVKTQQRRSTSLSSQTSSSDLANPTYETLPSDTTAVEHGDRRPSAMAQSYEEYRYPANEELSRHSKAVEPRRLSDSSYGSGASLPNPAYEPTTGTASVRAQQTTSNCSYHARAGYEEMVPRYRREQCVQSRAVHRPPQTAQYEGVSPKRESVLCSHALAQHVQSHHYEEMVVDERRGSIHSQSSTSSLPNPACESTLSKRENA